MLLRDRLGRRGVVVSEANQGVLALLPTGQMTLPENTRLAAVAPRRCAAKFLDLAKGVLFTMFCEMDARGRHRLRDCCRVVR